MSAKISHFVAIVDKDGNLVTPGLVRAVGVGLDDQPHRFSLMAVFAQMIVGQAFSVETQSQVWSFWELFALPAGFRIEVIEASEQPYTPPGTHWELVPDAPASLIETPAPADEPLDEPTAKPNTNEVGRA